MKILSPFDRYIFINNRIKFIYIFKSMSIVIFGTSSYIILPWLLNTAENKEKIKSTILGISSMGSTNIASGVENGLIMLKSR